MATYKVIQDIEAEDKLVGPFSLRQFIYASIVIVLGFISYQLILVNWLIAIPFLLPMVFFGLLAVPFVKDQPSEVWLLGKIRYYLKPRRRIWDQDGIQNLVTITAPKEPEKQLTKDFTQTEVQSRLKALANTIDSRGWAIKNMDVNMYAQPAFGAPQSDRLVELSSVQEVSDVDIHASDDMLDEQYNPTAQNLDRLINASSKAHREQVIAQMKAAPQPTPPNQPPADYWFMNQPQAPPPGYATGQPAVVTPGADQNQPIAQPAPVGMDEQALLDKLHKQQDQPDPYSSHLKTIQPLGAKTDTGQPPAPDPAILQLANNDDLNVATIARQANKKKDDNPDEVVISLH